MTHEQKTFLDKSIGLGWIHTPCHIFIHQTDEKAWVVLSFIISKQLA